MEINSQKSSEPHKASASGSTTNFDESEFKHPTSKTGLGCEFFKDNKAPTETTNSEGMCQSDSSQFNPTSRTMVKDIDKLVGFGGELESTPKNIQSTMYTVEDILIHRETCDQQWTSYTCGSSITACGEKVCIHYVLRYKAKDKRKPKKLKIQYL